MVGVLKAKTATGPDVWTPVGVAPFVPIHVGPSQPDNSYALWWDTDEPNPYVPTYGLQASRPAAPPAGSRYFATDTKRDALYDGTGWIATYEPLQTYTPYAAGVVNTVVTGNYSRSNGYVDFRATMTFPAGSSCTSVPIYLGIPIPHGGINRGMFTVDLFDGGVLQYSGINDGVAAGVVGIPLYAADARGTVLAAAAINTTTTWGSGDEIRMMGRYRMETPYL